MEDLKNYLLEFLKQQEILCKQEMEKIENQHRKESEQQEKRFSKLLETFSERENNPGSSNIFSQDSISRLINLYTSQTKKSHSEHTFGGMQKYSKKTV